MKISKIVTMKNLDTGKNEEIKLDTKEIREFDFPKKAYIIDKVFIDNMWLKIAVLVWVLVLSTLLVLAKISQNYGFLAISIFTSLITITLSVNFPIARLYFFGEEILNIKKMLIIRWVGAYIGEVKLPKSSAEMKKKIEDLSEQAIEEINKISIRFYFSHLVAVLALLSIIVLLIIENQPDKISLVFIVGVWIIMELYLWMIRYFIRTKARMLRNVAPRVDDSAKESAILEVKFSLNSKYIIEEEVELSKCIKVPSCHKINKKA